MVWSSEPVMMQSPESRRHVTTDVPCAGTEICFGAPMFAQDVDEPDEAICTGERFS